MFFQYLFHKNLHKNRYATALLSCLLSGACLTASAQQNSTIVLPELGDSAAAMVSQDEVHELGQGWLRQFRAQVPESYDALMYDYLDNLLEKLADHSALDDKRLELVVIKNPTLNAFAVPGGIVGVHNGIFQYADNEQQLAGVMAHELGHLSQRHWQRSVEEQKKNSIPTMAGMLAGLVLMGTTGSDAGMAAIMSTQAANLQARLRFSRENEAEADRVGMQTMVNANMDPRAVPAMFESMQRSTRYMGDRPPEFLLSHPVTEKRIADSRNRAEQYPLKQYPDNIDYQLMKVRARLALAENPSVAARMFQSEMSGENKQPEASRYGLAIAQIAQRQFDDAEKTLKPLIDKSPNKLPYELAQADILNGQGKYPQALALIQRVQGDNPHNYPATLVAANILENMKDYDKAVKQLNSLLPKYSDRPNVWYDLAELRGLAGDTGGVHIARAEYFILTGVFDQARQQLTYALQFYEHDRLQSGRIKERLRDLAVMENQSLE
ncbi:MAG TPA: M48 family metalloprotease [Pseudomonadales bacterium]|nr:M48 family metalloprotease [Pseudomonadales bacterium]